MRLDKRFPHPGPRIPILGDVFGADRHRPTQHEMKIAADLGPIFERKLLNEHLTIVTGGELAAACGDEETWARALAGPTMKFRDITRSGLFTARTSDPLWGQARRILDPGFTQSALRIYHDAMNSVVDDLIDSWAKQDTVDIHTAMTSATLEVIARAGFSRDLGLFSSRGPDKNVLGLLDTLAKVLAWASESSNDLPVVGDIRGALQRRSLQGPLNSARAYVDSIVAARAGGDEDSHDDLLGLMLTTVDPETNQPLPHDNIRDQVLTFLVAGHETTAALLEVTLWYLARYPNLLEAVRREGVRRGFDYDGVAGMRTTRNTLNESLRLWPPVPGYFRVSRRDQQLGGYDIPAGHSVFVHVLAAQRDSAGWGADVERFNPDRWDSKFLRRFPQRFFQPFGTGPRSCIGRAFAMQEAALVVSRIAATFDLSLAEPASEEPAMYERGTLRPERFTVRVSEASALSS